MNCLHGRPRLSDQISWEALENIMCQNTEISDFDIIAEIKQQALQTAKRKHINYEQDNPITEP